MQNNFWEEISGRIASNYSLANKLFRQTIRRLREKSSSTTTSINDSTGNIIKNEKDILLRWRRYFEDLLNSVGATPTDTYGTIDFGKEVFTLTKVAAAT